jgi:hypothetical protein
MEIKNETYILKNQKCRHCGAELEISKEDLRLDGDNLVYTCPCCEMIIGIYYTDDKNSPNIGTMREVQELNKDHLPINAIIWLATIGVAGLFLWILCYAVAAAL